MTLRAFRCNIRGKEWEHTIHALSAGKAKYEYFRDLREAWPEIPFTAVTCHVAGPVTTPESFLATARYRGVPFARIGMKVTVGEWNGLILGANASANFDVLFQDGPYAGQKLNCHPHSQTKYFAKDGTVLADFTEGRA